jgi:hypothetical protein
MGTWIIILSVLLALDKWSGSWPAYFSLLFLITGLGPHPNFLVFGPDYERERIGCHRCSALRQVPLGIRILRLLAKIG